MRVDVRIDASSTVPAVLGRVAQQLEDAAVSLRAATHASADTQLTGGTWYGAFTAAMRGIPQDWRPALGALADARSAVSALNGADRRVARALQFIAGADGDHVRAATELARVQAAVPDDVDADAARELLGLAVDAGWFFVAGVEAAAGAIRQLVIHDPTR